MAYQLIGLYIFFAIVAVYLFGGMIRFGDGDREREGGE
jgi:hypothetical protein